MNLIELIFTLPKRVMKLEQARRECLDLRIELEMARNAALIEKRFLIEERLKLRNIMELMDVKIVKAIEQNETKKIANILMAMIKD